LTLFTPISLSFILLRGIEIAYLFKDACDGGHLISIPVSAFVLFHVPYTLMFVELSNYKLVITWPLDVGQPYAFFDAAKAL
jgi:hypothetical protein